MATSTGNQAINDSTTTVAAPEETILDETIELAEEVEESSTRYKLYGVLAGIAIIGFLVALTAGLYTLGDEDQSALERLRDIAVIYIVLMSIVIVVVMAAATAALVYLIMQINGQVIPLLEEMNATLKRVRGTTEFMSDQAVKPVINAAGKVAQWKAMVRVATGREPK